MVNPNPIDEHYKTTSTTIKRQKDIKSMSAQYFNSKNIKTVKLI